MMALTFLAYCSYIVVVFSYTSHILEASKVKSFVFAVLMVLNSFLLFVPIFVTKFHYEILIMVLYVVALTVETMVVCKKGVVKTLFGVFSFAINFFAIRTLVIVGMAFVTGEPVAALLASEENRVLITTLNFFIPVPYILVTRKILKHSILDIALSETGTTMLSTVFLCVTFINQMAVFPSLLKVDGYLERNLYYHMATAVFSILVFVLVMVINYIYSNLKVVADTYSGKIDEIKLQEMTIKDIEDKSTIDAMTGAYVRNVAMDKLDEYIKDKKSCFIVFIDIDGLKLVNDRFGHNEGDWYIQVVAQKVKFTLGKHVVARLGGDEFLVVGESSNHDSITKTMLELEKEIANISLQNGKQYQTSISYGVQEIGPANTLSPKALVAKADEKMYVFKQGRKRNRA